jgi:hypothetical protein
MRHPRPRRVGVRREASVGSCCWTARARPASRSKDRSMFDGAVATKIRTAGELSIAAWWSCRTARPTRRRRRLRCAPRSRSTAGCTRGQDRRTDPTDESGPAHRRCRERSPVASRPRRWPLGFDDPHGVLLPAPDDSSALALEAPPAGRPREPLGGSVPSTTSHPAAMRQRPADAGVTEMSPTPRNSLQRGASRIAGDGGSRGAVVGKNPWISTVSPRITASSISRRRSPRRPS